MACMEHYCHNCNWVHFDNTSGPVDCPICGGDLIHSWDEANDHYGDEDCDFYRDFDSEPEICDMSEAEHELGEGDGEQDD